MILSSKKTIIPPRTILSFFRTILSSGLVISSRTILSFRVRNCLLTFINDIIVFFNDIIVFQTIRSFKKRSYRSERNCPCRKFPPPQASCRKKKEIFHDSSLIAFEHNPYRYDRYAPQTKHFLLRRRTKKVPLIRELYWSRVRYNYSVVF